MLNIAVTDDAREVLHALLDREEEASRFRLREFVSGCALSCRSGVRRVLRLTLERDGGEEEDDLSVREGGACFVMNELLRANYGNSFFITLGPNSTPDVIPLRPLFDGRGSTAAVERDGRGGAA
jgi:hypothetical protein